MSSFEWPLSSEEIVRIGEARRSLCDVSVSLDVVVSYIAPSCILQAPHPIQRRFGSLFVLRTEEIDEICARACSSILVCSASDARRVLPLCGDDALLLVLSEGSVDLDEDWLKQNRNRIVLCAIEKPFLEEAFAVQSRFMSVTLWQNEMNAVLLERGSLEELLDVGSRFLGKFMFVSDTGFNLVSHTTEVVPPNGEFEALVSRGCYTADEMRRIDEEVFSRVLNQTSVLFEIGKGVDACPQAHLTVFFDGELFFHITMVCDCDAIDTATKSLFIVFCEHAVQLCEGFWQDKMRVHSPWYRVLTNLIENVPMAPSYVELQLERTEIPRSVQFKLLCVDLKSCSSVSEKNRIASVSRKLNGGNVYPFMYYGQLLVLCYTPSSSDAQFSSRSMYADVEKLVYLPFGIRVTASATFYDIGRMRAAYLQAKYANRILSVIDKERTLADLSEGEAYTPFEDAVPYYVCADQTALSALKGFDFNQGMVRKIAAEDREMNTDVLHLLWLYMCCECNATTVAKKLHMHRNTVLYHIAKIEKRFDVDFSDYRMRSRVMFDMRMLFVSEGEESGLAVDGSRLMPDHDEEREIK